MWAALVAAMVLAAALWWLYFDAAAELNLRVLELSGGSPTIARAIFAAGHMLPAFALILIAAGLGLLLEGTIRRGPPTGSPASGSGSTSRARACSWPRGAGPAGCSGSSCSSRRSCSPGSPAGSPPTGTSGC